MKAIIDVPNLSPGDTLFFASSAVLVAHDWLRPFHRDPEQGTHAFKRARKRKDRSK